MKRLQLLLCFLGLCLVRADAQSQSIQPAGGLWAAKAAPLPFENGIRKVQIASPDRKKLASVDYTLTVQMKGRFLEGSEKLAIGVLAELLWSPDSKALSITSSDGGSVGTWTVTIFLIQNGTLEAVDIAGKVKSDFKSSFTCAEPEEPNIGLAAWRGGSSKVVLIAEVPPHSSCPEMGKIRGYVVSVPSGRILNRLTASQLSSRFGESFGSRIRNRRR